MVKFNEEGQGYFDFEGNEILVGDRIEFIAECSGIPFGECGYVKYIVNENDVDVLFDGDDRFTSVRCCEILKLG